MNRISWDWERVNRGEKKKETHTKRGKKRNTDNKDTERERVRTYRDTHQSKKTANKRIKEAGEEEKTIIYLGYSKKNKKIQSQSQKTWSKEERELFGYCEGGESIGI